MEGGGRSQDNEEESEVTKEKEKWKENEKCLWQNKNNIIIK